MKAGWHKGGRPTDPGEDDAAPDERIVAAVARVGRASPARTSTRLRSERRRASTRTPRTSASSASATAATSSARPAAATASSSPRPWASCSRTSCSYSSSANSGRRNSSNVCLVAAGDGARRERAHVRRSRDVHRERHLAEVVARPKHPPRHRAEIRDREHAVQDHVEAVALLALHDRRLAAADVLAPHLLRELRPAAPREAPRAARSATARPAWRVRASGSRRQ